MTARLEITASVWLLKSSDQYDYMSSYKRTVTVTVKHTAAVYQRDAEVFTAGIGEKVEGMLLAIVLVRKGSVVVLNAQTLGEHAKMWRVVREAQKHASFGYEVNEGDIIRLGNSNWEITEINTNQTAPTESSVLHPEVQESESRPCKICLSSEATFANPFVSPCACRGSVEHVHVNCLDTWIGTSSKKEERKYDKKYLWDSVKCSVCKNELPQEVEVNGEKFHNLGVPKPSDSDFIAVRNIDSPGHEIHIWQWNGHHSLSVGTGSSNKIQIQDSNLSDEHASIKLRKGRVSLQDHNSQYGTSVLVQEPIKIQKGGKVSVQCGNVLLSFVRKEKRRFFSCFSAPAAPPASESDILNEIQQAKQAWAKRNLVC